MGNVGELRKVLSDRGTQFTSKKWWRALEDKRIQMILISIRYLQANMVERVNRELATLFRTLLPQQRHNAWLAQLGNVETILNVSHHDTTEVTPYDVLWGRKPIRCWINLLPLLPPHLQTNPLDQWLVIRNRITRKREKKLAKINKNKKSVTYAVGEKVFAKACNVSNVLTGAMAKFLSLYEGPYQIKKRIASNVYILWNEAQDRERERAISRQRSQKISAGNWRRRG